MDAHHTLYLSLILISFALSVWCHKPDKSLRIFPFLLLLSLLTEAVVYLLYYRFQLRPQYFAVYHAYIPLEYLLLSSYFLLNVRVVAVKKMICYSLFLFVPLSAWLSFAVIGLFNFPGHILNLAGGFIIGWAVLTLFNVEPVKGLPLYRLPVFWICVGVLVYFSGGFFFNAVYQFFLESQSELARNLNRLINKGLNYILYLCFSVAFVCSNQLRKYTLP